MRLLIVLTYYRPHTSGLTIYAERLAKAWARRGHQVTVLTSRYSKDLAAEEVMDGVRIVRAPVLFRLSKGVVMPTFGFIASRLVSENDVIQLHLPQFDAAGIALRGRLLRKPTIITYHCDLQMPPGLMSRVANLAVDLMNHLAARFTHQIVTYTRDYAENSVYLKNYLSKLQVIQPPVELPAVSPEAVKEFSVVNNPGHCWPVIGMAARFATEKGVEVLLQALPAILKVYPNALVQFAGAYKGIMGEEHYFQKLAPQVKQFEQSGKWRFLDVLDPEKMATFYPNIDLLVLPSLNSTEAFGLVQIEAMMNGKPTVASDLPGVRQPVLQHKMGKIIPTGDSKALAEAVLDILANPSIYQADRQALDDFYSPDVVAAAYEDLFARIQLELHGRGF
jgi:glycosyltransferase involved in cell wall biosynthesis